MFVWIVLRQNWVARHGNTSMVRWPWLSVCKVSSANMTGFMWIIFSVVCIIIPPHKLPMQRILLVVVLLRMSSLNLKMTNGANLMISTQGAIFMDQSLREAKPWLLVDKQALSKFLIVKKLISYEIFFSPATEIWQLENGNNKIVNPTLTKNNYSEGIGLFAVDFNFCKKWFPVQENVLEINWNEK